MYSVKKQNTLFNKGHRWRRYETKNCNYCRRMAQTYYICLDHPSAGFVTVWWYYSGSYEYAESEKEAADHTDYSGVRGTGSIAAWKNSGIVSCRTGQLRNNGTDGGASDSGSFLQNIKLCGRTGRQPGKSFALAGLWRCPAKIWNSAWKWQNLEWKLWSGERCPCIHTFSGKTSAAGCLCLRKWEYCGGALPSGTAGRI